MYNPDIIHQLTAVNPYTPRALHDVFGIDYNKPFFAASIRGAFTVAKAEKIMTAAGIDPRDNITVLLIRDPGDKYHRRDGWHVVTLDGRGGFDIEHRPPYYENFRRSGFDYFFRKVDFNEDRKSQTAEAVIISQAPQDTHKPAEKTLDPGERYKVESIINGYNPTGNKHYVSRVTLKRTNDHGTRAEIGNTGRIIYRGQWEPETIGDVIDKSGYLVYDRRREWKRRARALRAEREKAAANAADYSKELAELDRLFRARRDSISAALAAATDSTDIKWIITALDDYKTGLKWAAYDLEMFQDAAENKKFTSPDRARAAYESIRAKLDPAKPETEVKTA